MSHDAKAVMDALHNHALLVIDQRSPVAAKQPVENVPSYPFTASFPGDGGWVSDELFAGALKNGTHTFFTLFLVPFSLPEGLHMCLGYPEAMKARLTQALAIPLYDQLLTSLQKFGILVLDTRYITCYCIDS